MATRPWFGLFRIFAILTLVIGAIFLGPTGLMLLLLWGVGEPEPLTSGEALAFALGCFVGVGFMIKAIVHLASMKDKSKPPRIVALDEVCKKCRRPKGGGQCIVCGYHAEGPRQAIWLFVLLVVPLAFLAFTASGANSTAGPSFPRPYLELGYLIYVCDFFATIWCACLWRRGRI